MGHSARDLPSSTDVGGHVDLDHRASGHTRRAGGCGPTHGWAGADDSLSLGLAVDASTALRRGRGRYGDSVAVSVTSNRTHRTALGSYHHRKGVSPGLRVRRSYRRGWLWGGFGLLWTRPKTFEMYVSRADGLVIVERDNGRPLLLTPERPGEFVRAVPGLFVESQE